MNSVEYLILSSIIDYSTDLICIELERRDAKYLRLNRDMFAEYDIIYSLSDAQIEININNSRYFISQQSLKSVFFRAPVFFRGTGKAYSLQEQLKRSQWSAFIRNLVIFDKAFWINHPVATYQAENKMFQLKIAQECGFCVPQTYVGNALPKNIVPNNTYIVKSLDTALFYESDKEMFTYSTMISGQELLDAEIKSAPIIIQDYLLGKKDIRVTVVNDETFPIAITNQGNSIIGDWRKHNKEQLEYAPIKLPPNVEKSIMTLMHKLKLSFGGIDLALVKDKYYFIEVNPTGEWGWLVSKFCPIDKAIVNCITGGNE